MPLHLDKITFKLTLTMTKRSEEVQDIIDRMPTYWCWWVAGLLTSLLTVLLLLSYHIKYPETVDGQVSITAQIAPVRLVAGSSGRLHLLVARDSMVRPNDVIAYVESGVNYEDYRLLKMALSHEADKPLPSALSLGELSTAYSAYKVAVERLHRLQTSERHAAVRQSLAEQITANQQVVHELTHARQLKEKVRENLAHEVQRDSQLQQHGLSSLSELVL